LRSSDYLGLEGGLGGLVAADGLGLGIPDLTKALCGVLGRLVKLGGLLSEIGYRC
jgi:hypothetical protein